MCHRLLLIQYLLGWLLLNNLLRLLYDLGWRRGLGLLKGCLLIGRWLIHRWSLLDAGLCGVWRSFGNDRRLNAIFEVLQVVRIASRLCGRRRRLLLLWRLLLQLLPRILLLGLGMGLSNRCQLRWLRTS